MYNLHCGLTNSAFSPVACQWHQHAREGTPKLKYLQDASESVDVLKPQVPSAQYYLGFCCSGLVHVLRTKCQSFRLILDKVVLQAYRSVMPSVHAASSGTRDLNDCTLQPDS